MHGQAHREHADDRCAEQRSPAPFAQQEMPRSGKEPSGDEWEIDETLLGVLPRVLDWCCCHSFLTITHEGSA